MCLLERNKKNVSLLPGLVGSFIHFFWCRQLLLISVLHHVWCERFWSIKFASECLTNSCHGRCEMTFSALFKVISSGAPVRDLNLQTTIFCMLVAAQALALGQDGGTVHHGKGHPQPKILLIHGVCVGIDLCYLSGRGGLNNSIPVTMALTLTSSPS